MVTPDTTGRRVKAIAGATRVAAALAPSGVRLKIIGSLVKGDFGAFSDVDFLITACPRHLKYAIEAKVEDLLDGLPFDVVYLDEIPAWKAASFIRDAVDVDSLR